jgi:hypothetical protein
MCKVTPRLMGSHDGDPRRKRDHRPASLLRAVVPCLREKNGGWGAGEYGSEYFLPLAEMHHWGDRSKIFDVPALSRIRVYSKCAFGRRPSARWKPAWSGPHSSKRDRGC